MNDRDRENLAWYLAASESERDAWAEEVGMKHLSYMIGLLRLAYSEHTLEIYDQLESELTDFTESQTVLARIMAL